MKRPITIRGITRSVDVEPLRGAGGNLVTERRVALIDDFGRTVASRLVLSPDEFPRILGVMTLDGPESLERMIFPIVGFAPNAA